MIRFRNKPNLSIPFYENFENGINNSEWHIENDDYYRTWDTVNTAENNISAYVNLYGYNPRIEQKDELISPSIVLMGDSVLLSFDVAYQKYNNSSKQDTLQIFLSNDCGENYSYKIFEKGGEDLSTYDQITADFIPENSDQWRTEYINLNEFSSQEILLKFVTTNLRGNNIFIDNIGIYDPNNINLFVEKNTEIYIQPNPSNGLFELSFHQLHINTINVYNNIGQSIIPPIKLNRRLNNYQLNLERHKPGTYYISIETSQKKDIIQIIKQ